MICDYCKKEYSSKWKLRWHLTTCKVRRRKIYTCECGSYYTNKKSFRSHQNLCNLITFQCNYCQSKWNTRGSRAQHQRQCASRVLLGDVDP